MLELMMKMIDINLQRKRTDSLAVNDGGMLCLPM